MPAAVGAVRGGPLIATNGGVWLRLAPLVILIHVIFVGAWVTHANPFADSRKPGVERGVIYYTPYIPRTVLCDPPSAGKATCYLDGAKPLAAGHAGSAHGPVRLGAVRRNETPSVGRWIGVGEVAADSAQPEQPRDGVAGDQLELGVVAAGVGVGA